MMNTHGFIQVKGKELDAIAGLITVKPLKQRPDTNGEIYGNGFLFNMGTNYFHVKPMEGFEFTQVAIVDHNEIFFVNDQMEGTLKRYRYYDRATKAWHTVAAILIAKDENDDWENQSIEFIHVRREKKGFRPMSFIPGDQTALLDASMGFVRGTVKIGDEKIRLFKLACDLVEGIDKEETL